MRPNPFPYWKYRFSPVLMLLVCLGAVHSMLAQAGGAPDPTGR